MKLFCSSKYKIAYAPVPKAASNSAKVWIDSDFEVNDLEHPFIDNYTKITIVRNPYSRAISSYNWIIRHNRRISKFAGFADKSIDFLTYTRILKDNWNEARELELHCEKQCKIISDPSLFTQVIKLEDVDESIAKLSKSISPELSTTLPMQNPSSDESVDPIGIDAYTAESIDIIRELYAGDFNAFGYSTGFPGKI